MWTLTVPALSTNITGEHSASAPIARSCRWSHPAYPHVPHGGVDRRRGPTRRPPAASSSYRGTATIATSSVGRPTILSQSDRKTSRWPRGSCPARSRRHLLAVYGFARLVDDIGDEAAGDRLALLDWLEPSSQRAAAGHGHPPAAAPARSPSIAELGPAPRAVRRSHRGQPAGPVVRATRPSTTSSATACCRRRRSAVWCCCVLGGCDARAHQAGPTTSASACSSSSTSRTSPRTLAQRPGVPAARRSRSLRVRRSRTVGARAPGPRSGASVALECRPGLAPARARAPLSPRRCPCGRGSRWPASPPAASPRSTRSSGAGFDVLARRCRPTPLRFGSRLVGVLARSAARPAPSHAPGGCVAGRHTDVAAYDRVREPSPGARRRTSPTASVCCGPPSGGRCRRCTPWLAASTTSATADRATERRSSAGSRKELRKEHRRARTSATTRCSSRSARCRRAATDCRWSAFDELIDGCEMDVHGTHYETIDDLVALLPPGRRLGRPAVAGRLRRPTTPGRRSPLADDLGVALQLTNILRDVVEDRERGRVYLPADDARRSAARPISAARPTAVAALVALRVRAGRGVVRARAWSCSRCSTAAAGPASAPWPASTGACSHRIERDPIAVTAGPGVAARPGRRPCVAVRAVGRGSSVMSRDPTIVVVGGGPGRASPPRSRRPTPAPRSPLLERRGHSSAGSPGPSSATGCGSTTASTCSSAAAPPTGAFLDRIGAADQVVPAGPPRASRCSRPGGAGPTSRGRRCRRPLHLLGLARPLPPPLAGRPRPPAAARSLALRRLDLDDPALDRGGVRRRGSRDQGQSARGHRPAVGPHRAADGQRARRRGLAGAGGQGLPDRPARPGRRRRHRLVPVPLGELHGEHGRAGARRRRASRLVLGATVHGAGGLVRRAARWRCRSAGELEADAVVVATPPRGRPAVLARGVLDAARAASEPRRSSTCTWSSTAGSPTCRSPPRVGSPVQFVFDRTEFDSGAISGQCLVDLASRAPTRTSGGGPRSSSGLRRRARRRLPAGRATARLVDGVVTPRAGRHLPGGPRNGGLAPGRRVPRWTGSSSPARGATPDGRRRWRARSAAAGRRPAGPAPSSRSVRPARRHGAAVGSVRRSRDDPSTASSVSTGRPGIPGGPAPVSPRPACRRALVAPGHRRGGRPAERRAARAGASTTWPAGGKGVRPALGCCRPRPPGPTRATGLPGAVAVELIHNFSLIHDDIIDNDRERRHRPTVWAAFGVGRAIVAGDALADPGHQVLLEAPDARAGRRRGLAEPTPRRR